MKHLDEAAAAPETIGKPAAENGSGALPPLPSEDQKFFNEAQREGMRGMGALVRSRRKPK